MPRRATGSIARRGDRYFVRLTRPDGTRTTRGSWGSRKEAEAAVPDLIAEMLKVEPLRHEVTLLGFLEDEYRDVLRARVAESTRELQESILRSFAAWWTKQRDPAIVRAVAATDVEAYCGHATETLMLSTLARHVQVLRHTWDALMRRGYADANPWRGVKLARSQERVIPWVDPGDLVRLYAAVHPRHRGFVRFLAETGLRLGVAYALERLDVDLGRGVVVVRRSKGRKVREVPLLPGAAAALEEALAATKEARVFSALLSHDTLRQDLALAAARVGLPPLRIHDLRHVYASHLVRAGVPVPAVAALLGHADGGALVLARYGRWQPEDAAARAVRRLLEFRGDAQAPASTGAPRALPG